MTEEQVFLAALDLDNLAERTAYLKRVCGGDDQFRRQVEDLLTAHFKTGEFLDEPVGKLVGAGASTPQINDNTVSIHDNPAEYADDGEKKRDQEPDVLHFLQPSTRPDSLGRIGHYEVLQVVGSGGFGIVFRAFDEVLRRVVALKVLSPTIAATSPARKRFLREARSSAQVRHENVVQVHAVGELPLPYLVMEFIPGETLQQRLDHTGPLDAAEVVRLGRQIAEGLAAAHATGLIHRDIKPGNIIIEKGRHGRVKITDFGLAQTADDASLSQSGVLAGTPMYMAPEQAKGEALDHRADLFSLGSVLYVMAAGRPPFRASTTFAVLKRVTEDDPRPIREMIPEIPPWLCEIIARLQAKKPEDRFATAREVADLLGQRQEEMQHSARIPGVKDIPSATPPASDMPAAAPAIRRPGFRTLRRAAGAALFLVLLGSLGFTETTGVTDFRGAVIRLFSPKGTLVVEVDDPAVSVKIDGSELVITGAGAKEIRLKPGRYTVEASKGGKLLRQELVTVTKNDRKIVRVSQEPPLLDAKEKGVGAQTNDPDRRAAEYVLANGGKVRVDGRMIQSATALPKEAVVLTGVWLAQNEQVNDAGLAAFKDCKNLTELILFECGKVTDAGLEHFKGCKNLTLLDLNATPVTDAGLKHFENCKKLTYLSLPVTRVTDAGLANLKDYKNLISVSLIDTAVTDAGLAHLKDCKNLTILWLNHTTVTDAGLAHLKDCNNLTGLSLQTTKVTAAGIDELKKALPRCKIEWDGGTIEPRGASDTSPHQ